MALLTDSTAALRDVILGWQRREGWWALSRQSMKINYRRTTLGPIWIAVQQIAFITGISLLYSQLFKIKSADLVPLVAFGISFWGLLTRCITSASSTFIQQSRAISSSTLPMSFYVFNSVSQEILTYLHSVIVLIPFVIVFGTSPRLICLVTIPLAIIFAATNAFALGLWLGPLSARYRDVTASIPIIIQLAMFLSPVFWPSSLLSDRDWIIYYNPIAWMIETFRAPILGGPVHFELWIRLTLFTFTNLVFGVYVLGRVRNKIAYWI